MPRILSKRFATPIAALSLLSLALLFLPLAGALGFEFSVVVAFAGSFAAVFSSAEYALEARKSAARGIALADMLCSVALINLIMLALPFIIGLSASLLKGDCSVSEGIIFYLLIPCVSVFFSSSLGFLLEILFPRKGFFLGALVLIGAVSLSLWRLYAQMPVFSYNPVFGFFPGPLYDEAIAITPTLVLYRVSVLCWGAGFIIASSLALARTQVWGRRLPAVLAMIPLAAAILFFHVKREDFGFIYSRGYVARNFLQGIVETEHFIIRYSPGSPEARMIKLIAEDHEWRYYQLKRYLNVSSGEKIRSYIYPDEKTRKKIIGAGETTVANPIHREIHLVYDGFPHAVLKHELVHVMASEFGTRILGISPKIGLVEGIAVAADWSENGLTPHQWSRAMIDSGAAPDIEDIVGLGFWHAPPRKSYTLMGSFCRYLIENYGIERFKYLYRTGDFGIYKKNLDGLVSEWRGYLGKISMPAEAPALAGYRFSAPAIFGARCPRKIAALRDEGVSAFASGNLYRAKDLFSQALGYDGGDASLAQSLAYASYYDRDFPETLRVADKIPAGASEVDANILLNIRANALWQLGKSKEALTIFKSLRDSALPADIDREIEIKLSVLAAGLGIQNRIKIYFSTRDKLTQLAALTELTAQYPRFAPAYYLLGRMFFNNSDYERASLLLSKADSAGLPSDTALGRENLRLLGIALYALGRYGEASDVIGRASRTADSGAWGFALDFIDRCRWAMRENLN